MMSLILQMGKRKMLNILNEIAVEEENANLDVTRPGRREWASTRAASIIT